VATLFIADLHLQTEEPAITAGFLRFYRRSPQADALYILGDLFEAWIGDDDPNPLHQQIASAINALTQSGVPCYFVHGNRDFLVGQRFARESGMTPAGGRKVLDLYGRRVLIMHGDTLCTDDPGYLAFRAKVHSVDPASVPCPAAVYSPPYRRQNARRQQSGQQQQVAGNYGCQSAGRGRSAGKTSGTVADSRPHRPAVHPLEANGKPAFRVVLGAWHSEGSMVKVSKDDVELISFPF
jgi:UDP-2,3-diacylglucosamine hydrolase